MRAWTFLLGGILVWAADFFLLYAIGSIALTTTTARILSLIVTAAALAADAWLLWHARSRFETAESSYDLWFARIAILGAAISAVAVIWQGFPAIFV